MIGSMQLLHRVSSVFGGLLYLLFLSTDLAAGEPLDIGCKTETEYGIVESKTCREFASSLHNALLKYRHGQVPWRAVEISLADRLGKFSALELESCYVLVTLPLHYKKAREMCAEHGGHLAWVTRPEQVDNLIEFALLHDVTKTNKTVDGDESGFEMVWSATMNKTEKVVHWLQNTSVEMSRGGVAVEDIWVGMTRKAQSSAVIHDCKYRYSHHPVEVTNLHDYCFIDQHIQYTGLGSLCQRNDNTSRKCLCWNYLKNWDQHPFYCQKSFGCTTTLNTTRESHNVNASLPLLAKSAGLGEKVERERYKGEDYADKGLNVDSWYIVVSKNVTYDEAVKECSDEDKWDGRLAWVDPIYANFDIGLETLQQFVGDMLKGDAAWIGLDRWGTVTPHQKFWSCPDGKGLAQRYTQPLPFTHTPQPGQDFQNTTEHAYLKKNGSVQFVSSRTMKAGYICEVQFTRVVPDPTPKIAKRRPKPKIKFPDYPGGPADPGGPVVNVVPDEPEEEDEEGKVLRNMTAMLGTAVGLVVVVTLLGTIYVYKNKKPATRDTVDPKGPAKKPSQAEWRRKVRAAQPDLARAKQQAETGASSDAEVHVANEQVDTPPGQSTSAAVHSSPLDTSDSHTSESSISTNHSSDSDQSTNT